MQAVKPLLDDIRRNRLLWLLAIVPVLFAAKAFEPEGHALLFVLSVLGIIPLAALLSHATESVASKTGDAIGGLLNATLGNLTELIIALTALHAGQYVLVKASIAGAIVTASPTTHKMTRAVSGKRPARTKISAATVYSTARRRAHAAFIVSPRAVRA